MSHPSPTRSRLARFFTLSSGERRVFLLAAMLLPLVRLSIVLSGFGHTREALRVLFRTQPTSSTTSVGVSTTARLVRAAARHGGSGATCLPRSLVTWALLRRQGVDAVLRIGTRLAQTPPGLEARPGIEAHAWVEACGSTLDDVAADATAPSFVPFAPIA